MTHTDYKKVYDEIQSTEFDTFQCIIYLKRYCHVLGIHHALVKKLSTFTYDELEFYIPQFIQLIVNYETDSMALEDFLMDYSSRYPHFSLVVFWNLQAYIFELRNEPESYPFQIVRRFVNKLQDLLFNPDAPIRKAIEFRENLQPALVLCGAIAAAFALPGLTDHALPLIRSQAKQQKSFVFKLANFQKTLTKNLTLKNQSISHETTSLSDDESSSRNQKNDNINTLLQRSASVSRIGNRKESFHDGRRSTLSVFSDDSEFYTTDDELEPRNEQELTKMMSEMSLSKSHTAKAFNDLEENLRINTLIKSKKSIRAKTVTGFVKTISTINQSTQSLPDLTKDTQSSKILPSTESESSLVYHTLSTEYDYRKSADGALNALNAPTYHNLLKTLQVNYAKKETSFILALQNISLRLSQVPKEARLSALRAELLLVNETLLPSEIDIPQLLPKTSSKNKYHKILRLSVNDACVLNSAERVPFLLLIEYLSDELDFNPFSDYNQKIILNKQNGVRDAKQLIEGSNNIQTDSYKRSPLTNTASMAANDSIYQESETDLGDLPMVSGLSQNLNKLAIFEGNISTPNSPRSEFSEKGTNSNETLTKVLADQMRIASVMLQQLESSGQANSEQSIAIKNRIVQSMISLQDQFEFINYEKLNELRGESDDAGDRKMENDFMVSEDWKMKKARIRQSSIYGHLKNWDLCSVIAKNGDDLPQEAFACQLITLMSSIWKKHNVEFWTKRMKILITSSNTGLVETINNSMSIHSIKKSLTEMSIKRGENLRGRIFTLKDYFEGIFGPPEGTRYRKAQDNFTTSLASYSIICYILQIKDRHNGNIMVDNEGHIIHIDFGFLLSNSPGSVGFEAAPFKLTAEYVELMGGVNSPVYAKFLRVCKDCFRTLRKEGAQIVNIVELMQKDSSLPCFNNGDNTSVLLQQRLQLDLADENIDEFVETALVGKSIGSMYTRLYDQFQMITQGIYS
ncbi:Phosphatidylinositol 4-kinase pik1alpha (PI4-kinase)(PtdIns-4-kinase) [Scheffersomyces spartinae]|uniref:1-phosphatidylinositol 4-kinase n=1 Tax=Scheffersomyces spartinae TaxID=45513 RepID=A0A9P7VEE9_9ASCO|nr:Phosphatidylinositol 4-kinase pik1alpha (PI4-kinase)(PtdIns-4-kinase) [Scheffersomyces spartinae]KAG7196152.1 Phosphatidylinositol 4-kinase pik1alpha (PI4-kinase)(PtdIns-4-kinase) [Scheffersomyces spartinae]